MNARKFTKCWLPAILWTAAIFAVSTAPGMAVAPAAKVPFSTAAAHFGEFLVFSFLISRALMHEKMGARKNLVLTVLAGFAYSATTEILQLYVPGRFFSYNDILINDVGVLAGLLLMQHRVLPDCPRQFSSGH